MTILHAQMLELSGTSAARPRHRTFVGAVIVSYLLISTFAGDRAVGQQQAASAAARYEMAVGQMSTGKKNELRRNEIYVLDTQIGRVWTRYYGAGTWSDLGNPARKDKKE